MNQNVNFLCELGTEEIPAGYIPPAMNGIEKIIEKQCAEMRLSYDSVEVKATPRRLVFGIAGLADSQETIEQELKGPAASAAFKDGEPTKALQGFLGSKGLTVDDVVTRETPKGEYVFATQKLTGKPTVEVIPELVTTVVESLSFPKKMKWGEGSLMFPRPLRYIAALFNGAPVSFSVHGVESGNTTRGHFVLSDKMVEIPSVEKYEEILVAHNVTLDHSIRKERIHEQLLQAAKDAGGLLREDDELLDTVTFLVENPHVVTCTFDEEFLEVPDIALIAEMREHQKYFSVVNTDGSLTSTFLVVANVPPSDFVRQGNERVIRARFNDARFFFQEDRKLKLEDRVDGLKKVLFHKELGSVYDKVERMRRVGRELISLLQYDAKIADKTDRAILLSKTDLETAMVNEFASLQGSMGRIYAELDGEDAEVAAAIEGQYRPRFHGDDTPEGPVAILLSMAEKIDNIFGSWSVGNIPKGSQDPYALRRQGHAIIEMIVSAEMNLSLQRVLEAVAEIYTDGESHVPAILDFLLTRARTYFTDRDIAADEYDAVRGSGDTDILELYRRATALHEYRQRDGFTDMLLGFKRMNNIISSFHKKVGESYTPDFDESLLAEKAEKELFSWFQGSNEKIKSLTRESRYIELFEILYQAKDYIDRFFDDVMVMAEDEKVRDTRVALLKQILSAFSSLLDFSAING